MHTKHFFDCKNYLISLEHKSQTHFFFFSKEPLTQKPDVRMQITMYSLPRDKSIYLKLELKQYQIENLSSCYTSPFLKNIQLL